MTIIATQNGDLLQLALVGRLDTTTAPELEAKMRKSLDGVNSPTLAFKELKYIFSAGLRVLLSAQKQMSKQGEVVICNVNDTIAEVFDVTELSDILTHSIVLR